MPKRKKGSTIYYSDIYNDDFEKTGLKRPPIPADYKFKRENPINNFFSNLLYFGLAIPLLGLICIFNGVKVKNKKNIRVLNKTGGFIYANHTNFLDMFQIQVLVEGFKTRTNIIGYSDTAGIPFVKHVARALGYIPIPDDLEGQAKFIKSLKFYCDKKQPIIVYPEAHIWPYYTDIRPFKTSPFHYPAKFNVPIIPIVTVFRKGLFKNSKPRETLIVGEVIYPKEGLSLSENKEYLRDECYKKMKEISSSYEQYSFYNYIYREK